MYMPNARTQRQETQRNLYFTDSSWGFAFRVKQILGLALGVMQILAFLDTNANGFVSQWNIGFTLNLSAFGLGIFLLYRN